MRLTVMLVLYCAAMPQHTHHPSSNTSAELKALQSAHGYLKNIEQYNDKRFEALVLNMPELTPSLRNQIKTYDAFVWFMRTQVSHEFNSIFIWRSIALNLDLILPAQNATEWTRTPALDRLMRELYHRFFVIIVDNLARFKKQSSSYAEIKNYWVQVRVLQSELAEIEFIDTVQVARQFGHFALSLNRLERDAPVVREYPLLVGVRQLMHIAECFHLLIPYYNQSDAVFEWMREEWRKIPFLLQRIQESSIEWPLRDKTRYALDALEEAVDECREEGAEKFSKLALPAQGEHDLDADYFVGMALCGADAYQWPAHKYSFDFIQKSSWRLWQQKVLGKLFHSH